MLAGLLAVTMLCAQQPVAITLSVVDKSGAAIAGASVQAANGPLLGRTDTNGQLTIHCRIPCRLRIEAQGFAGKFIEVSANTTVQLDPAGTSQQVTVTAYRTPLGRPGEPCDDADLSAFALSTTASITMDGQVRQLPGVELFRRSSSLVANPTSQGISLRGLGSTSASRTLVTEDDVPLNDPLGGWIHWEEPPELAIDRIEVVRGGASDLYGSSAIGGVVNVIARAAHQHPGASCVPAMAAWARMTPARCSRPSLAHGECLHPAARSALTDLSRRLHTSAGRWIRLPICMGRTDLIDAEHDRGPLRLFVRGSGFNEATREWHALSAEWNAALALCDRRGLASSAQCIRDAASLWIDGALSADLLQHFECADSRRSNLLLSLRRDTDAIHAGAGQRARRGCALEPADRRGVSCDGRGATYTMCGCGIASRPWARPGR